MKIIMLGLDDGGNLGVTVGEGITPELGLQMCEVALEDGLFIPEPRSDESYSVKFVAHLPQRG